MDNWTGWHENVKNNSFCFSRCLMSVNHYGNNPKIKNTKLSSKLLKAYRCIETWSLILGFCVLLLKWMYLFGPAS